MTKDLAKYLGLIPQTPPKDKMSLSGQESLMVLLHLEGKSAKEICNTLNVPSARVYRILRSSAAQNMINDFLQFQDQELKVLYQLAVDAIRTGLQAGDPDVRLRASDRYFRIHGKYKSESTRETAEDVVRRIMEVTERTKDGSKTVKLTEERSLSGVQ